MKTESSQNSREKEIEKLKKYKYGFTTDIESTKAPRQRGVGTLGEVYDLVFKSRFKSTFLNDLVG